MPEIGALVRVCGYRDGVPWSTSPGQVYAQRGGAARRVGKRWVPGRIVEYRVGGYQSWYPWFRLVPAS